MKMKKKKDYERAKTKERNYFKKRKKSKILREEYYEIAV